ncbi:dephospho-CoA kinase [Paenibacillus sp. P96]|uniref:Dephospho-CoA kinase n=1 Tax=Paenibacillus zeirhizosphaerae TaxID=2987519 RepID=A0ABT9FT03_9BACL|nr:dephospho-CoA kinase [Paenibacillus sp. P96]MDP4097863.1 dephospho-CoA kinase [Paenibacillus sp. P96]
MIIGLTGGIATGKSTVSALLAAKGALIVDADAIAREVMLPGHPVLEAVVHHFGQGVLHGDGTLHRKKLGEIVFANPAEREALNEITHPAIRQEMIRRMNAYEAEFPDKLIIVDIPLLYESRLDNLFHKVMVVYVQPEVQLERLMKRDGLTAEQARQRLNAQLPIEEKKRLADIVVDNSRDVAFTERQLNELLERKEFS